jgi:Flp pilus assembly protein TadG
MKKTRSRRRDRGQALVEVALVAPLFFLMFFGIIDLARVIWANDAVANAAREGARFASVNAGSIPNITTEATTDEIRARALQFVVAGGVGATVTVCFSKVHIASETVGCSGDVSETGAEYDSGNLVTVRVESRVPVLAGALVGHGDFVVTGESTVLINN